MNTTAWQRETDGNYTRGSARLLKIGRKWFLEINSVCWPLKRATFQAADQLLATVSK